MVRRYWHGIIRLLAFSVVAFLLVGCGAASAAGSAPPTVEPVATPLLPPECLGPQASVCAAALTVLDAAGQTQLPDNLAYQPLPAHNFTFGPPAAGNALFISGNPINLLVTVANPTNAPLTVDDVWLRVVGFTPFTGTIPNAFAACDMRAYTTRGVQPLGTCALGDDPPATYGYPVALAGAITPGMVIPLQLAYTAEGHLATGTISIAPYQTSGGNTTQLAIAIAPQRAGTYQFQVGILVHGGVPQYFAPVLAALAVNPSDIQTYWSADNCPAFARQGQLPATGAYLCPGPVTP